MDRHRTSDGRRTVVRQGNGSAPPQRPERLLQSFDNITLRDTATAHFGNIYQDLQNDGLTRDQRCLQTFKTGTYEQHKNRNPSRADNTCLWVFSHPRYAAWRTSERDALLWISADPGCGKSVLAKSLIDTDLCTDENESVCYFFFKENFEEQDNLNAALCALLHQLFSQQFNLIHHAVPSWERNGPMIRRETLELWNILRRAVADPEARPVFCVLDALDECRDEDRRQLIELLSSFCEPTGQVPAQCALKFLVTSRPYQDIQQWFNKATTRWPQIRLHGEHENQRIQLEISSVVKQRVNDLADELALTGPTCFQLETQLLGMENRTYLWLDLAIAEVRQNFLDSLWPNKVVLQTLPSSVEDAYERLLQRIGSAQKTVARRVLLIIVGARRPLSIAEMACALGSAQSYDENGSSIEPANEAHLEAHIREWCGLFIFIQHGLLFLVHQTAKDFLLSSGKLSTTGTDYWGSCFEPQQVDKVMANICMTYMLQASSPEKIFGPFGMYCAYFWVSHAQHETFFDDSENLSKALILYDSEGPRFRWFNASASHVYYNLILARPLQIQHAATLMNHAVFLKKLWEKIPFDLEATGLRGRTALYCGAEMGNVAAVQTLLDAGADANCKYYGLTPLHVAVGRGDTEMVSVLVGAGANVNFDNAVTWAPPLLLAAHGHTQVFRVLLEAGADVNCKYNDETPLYAATSRGDTEMVSILIGAGANVNFENAVKSPLHLAAGYGRTEVVRILLEAGADPNVQNSDKTTPLEIALLCSDDEIVRLLDMWLLGDEEERHAVQTLRSALVHKDWNIVSNIFSGMDRSAILARLSTLGLPKFRQVNERLVRFSLGWERISLNLDSLTTRKDSQRHQVSNQDYPKTDCKG